MENTFKITGNSAYLYANTKTALRYINKPRINQPVLDTDFIAIDEKIYFRCQKNYLENTIDF